MMREAIERVISGHQWSSVETLRPPKEIAWRDEAVLAQEDARGGATPLQLHHHVDHLAAE